MRSEEREDELVQPLANDVGPGPPARVGLFLGVELEEKAGRVRLVDPPQDPRPVEARRAGAEGVTGRRIGERAAPDLDPELREIELPEPVERAHRREPEHVEERPPDVSVVAVRPAVLRVERADEVLDETVIEEPDEVEVTLRVGALLDDLLEVAGEEAVVPEEPDVERDEHPSHGRRVKRTASTIAFPLGSLVAVLSKRSSSRAVAVREEKVDRAASSSKLRA